MLVACLPACRKQKKKEHSIEMYFFVVALKAENSFKKTLRMNHNSDGKNNNKILTPAHALRHLYTFLANASVFPYIWHKIADKNFKV